MVELELLKDKNKDLINQIKVLQKYPKPTFETNSEIRINYCSKPFSFGEVKPDTFMSKPKKFIERITDKCKWTDG